MTDQTDLTYHFNKILAKSAIYVMAILLCLPCALKQEIKHVLDVPASQLERFEKPEKAAICVSMTVDEVRSTFGSNVENESIYFTKASSFIPRPQIYQKASHDTYPTRGKPFFSPIPIFVLHERYLI